MAVGKHTIERKNGKYYLDGNEVTFDDLIELKSAIQQLIEAEHREMLEERKARGEITYKEVRASGEVIQY
ncbi:MAG: hypothetical protein QXF58_05185 [Desulfurococcaceae archaeon]